MTNTSKIHLYVEQFSLKMNWKLAEGLLYNQGCKKDIHVIREEGKKSSWSQGLCPWEGTEEEGEYRGGLPPWEVNGKKHRLGTPVLVS